MALLVLALERFDSPWAIGLILLADVIPGMLLGPLFGAVADRWSRRNLRHYRGRRPGGRVRRPGARDDFAVTVGFALLAGVGTALFQPASLAALPGLVAPARLPAATSLYGALMDVGFMAGPAIAAGFMLAGGPEAVLVANAITFAVSAVLLASIRFGEAPRRDEREAASPSLIRDVRDGLAAAARIPGLRVLLLASAGALFFAGTLQRCRASLATDELGASEAGFSVLVAIYGLGFVGGSLAGARGGAITVAASSVPWRPAPGGAGHGRSGLAPDAVVAALCFVGAGYGAGLLLVHERLLIQKLVPDELGGEDLRSARRADGVGMGDRLRRRWPLLLEWARDARDGCAGRLRSLRGVARGRHRPEACLARMPASTGRVGSRSASGVGGGDLAWPGRAGQHGPDLIRRR